MVADVEEELKLLHLARRWKHCCGGLAGKEDFWGIDVKRYLIRLYDICKQQWEKISFVKYHIIVLTVTAKPC